MKIHIINWGDDAYARTKKATGVADSEIIATVEISSFQGFTFDGGRLDIVGHPETIWVSGHQWSVHVVDEASSCCDWDK